MSGHQGSDPTTRQAVVRWKFARNLARYARRLQLVGVASSCPAASEDDETGYRIHECLDEDSFGGDHKLVRRPRSSCHDSSVVEVGY